MMMEALITSSAVNPTPMVADVPRIALKSNRTITMKQTILIGTVSTSTTVPTFAGINFSLSAVGNVGAFTALFDSWRILYAAVRFIPTVVPVPGAVNPPLLTVLDYDDSNTPTALGDLRDYDTLYETSYGRYLERRLVPAYAVATYSGAFTSFSQARNWCDIASPGIQWYGLKYGISATASAVAAWSIEADILLQFKCVR